MLVPLLLALTPYLVKDIAPGKIVEKTTLDFFSGRAVGNVVFFRGDGAEPGLWCTDGTDVGTYRVYDEMLQHQRGIPATMTVSGRTVYTPIDTLTGTHLFTSDGTTPGTRFVKTIERWNGGAPCGDGKVCFAGANSEIGVTDGTAEGTSILLATAPGEHTPLAWQMTSFGKRAFFNTYDERAGQCGYGGCGELWVTDGTVAGTHLFKDLNPGPSPGMPYSFFASSQGKLFFHAAEPGTQSGFCVVWGSDGTPEGTRPLRTDRTFLCGGGIAQFVEAGGHVYYRDAFSELMQSDGTPQSTLSVWPEQADSSRTASGLSAINDTLLIETVGAGLWAYRGKETFQLTGRPLNFLGAPAATRLAYFENDGDLWSTDGTPAETRRLFRLPSFGGTLAPYAATPRQFFYVSGERELYVSDGTESGTRKLAFTALAGDSSTPHDLLPFGDKVLFTTDKPLRHNVSDGTAAGTESFADAETSRPTFLHQGRVYYRDKRDDLWITDGTAAGTRRVDEWLGAARIFYPPSFIGETAIFAAYGVGDAVLMRRDAGGTATALDLRGDLGNFTAAGDRVTFLFSHPGEPAALMVTDGTNEGTKRLASDLQWRGGVMPFGRNGLFGAWSKESRTLSLFTTDFTEAGTHAVRVISGNFDDEIIPVMEWQGVAIFAVGDPDSFKWDGEPLWRSDGTAAGTYPLSDARFRYAVADGGALTLIRKTYLGDGLGWEIWTSDGSAAGTRLRWSGRGQLMSAPFTLPSGEIAFAHMNGANELDVRTASTNAATAIDLGDLQIGPVVHAKGGLYFGGCRGTTGCELWGVSLAGGPPRADTAAVRVAYRGTASTVDGRAAIFRVSMETSGASHPTVVATTANGTLHAGDDYVPFEKTIVFDEDRDVTLVVPLRSDESSGTLSVVLSAPTNAVITQGVATAVIDEHGRRRAARH